MSYKFCEVRKLHRLLITNFHIFLELQYETWFWDEFFCFVIGNYFQWHWVHVTYNESIHIECFIRLRIKFRNMFKRFMWPCMEKIQKKLTRSVLLNLTNIIYFQGKICIFFPLLNFKSQFRFLKLLYSFQILLDLHAVLKFVGM